MTTAASDGEIVMIMGLPGAGKSTLARRFVSDGYVRLNRDERGGTLRELLPAIDRHLAAGETRIVLDNTYMTRQSRGAVLLAASRQGLPVRCIWLSTSLDDAQVNAVERMLAKYGRLLEPDEIRRTARRDPGTFAPGVQFRNQRELEPPAAAEGFSTIERVPFDRSRDSSFVNRAVILWCDGVLREAGAGPGVSRLIPGRRGVLSGYHASGWLLFGISWEPGVADDPGRRAEVERGLAHLRDALGLPIRFLWCPHAAGPPRCWCRKPLPGLGVVAINEFKLDPAACIYVGSGPQDPGFARKLGLQYREADGFFGGSA